MPCRVRLVKYVAGTSSYVLATTLLDRSRYRVADLSDLYHGRWGIQHSFRRASDLSRSGPRPQLEDRFMPSGYARASRS